jgi:hypothetical protein
MYQETVYLHRTREMQEKYRSVCIQHLILTFTCDYFV